MGLERGSLSPVSTNEELLERKSSGSGLDSREYCRRDPSRWPCDTLYLQKLALTSPTSGGRSIGIVRSRTQVTKFFLNSSQYITLNDEIISEKRIRKYVEENGTVLVWSTVRELAWLNVTKRLITIASLQADLYSRPPEYEVGASLTQL
jgi:hypothetical protein